MLIDLISKLSTQEFRLKSNKDRGEKESLAKRYRTICSLLSHLITQDLEYAVLRVQLCLKTKIIRLL